MKTILLIVLLSLSACALTPTEKRIVKVGAAVLVAGAIAAHNADNGSQDGMKHIPTACTGEPCK